ADAGAAGAGLEVVSAGSVVLVIARCLPLHCSEIEPRHVGPRPVPGGGEPPASRSGRGTGVVI
ncbi:MAG: hypothetical protein ACF8NJ_04035, partial [Phycisphaerales bacterium JB038]